MPNTNNPSAIIVDDHAHYLQQQKILQLIAVNYRTLIQDSNRYMANLKHLLSNNLAGERKEDYPIFIKYELDNLAIFHQHSEKITKILKDLAPLLI